jgi:hypothetical protein
MPRPVNVGGQCYHGGLFAHCPKQFVLHDLEKFLCCLAVFGVVNAGAVYKSLTF